MRDTMSGAEGAGQASDSPSASFAAERMEAPDVDRADARQSAPAALSMRDAEPPTLPRPRMPLAQRAKIFIPFDPLKGYQEALRQKEREAEARTNERANLEDPA